jgi:hypothetical protein
MLIQIQTIKASNLASRAIVNESLSLRFFSCIPLSIRVTRNSCISTRLSIVTALIQTKRNMKNAIEVAIKATAEAVETQGARTASVGLSHSSNRNAAIGRGSTTIDEPSSNQAGKVPTQDTPKTSNKEIHETHKAQEKSVAKDQERRNNRDTMVKANTKSHADKSAQTSVTPIKDKSLPEEVVNTVANAFGYEINPKGTLSELSQTKAENAKLETRAQQSEDKYNRSQEEQAERKAEEEKAREQAKEDKVGSNMKTIAVGVGASIAATLIVDAVKNSDLTTLSNISEETEPFSEYPIAEEQRKKDEK